MVVRAEDQEGAGQRSEPGRNPPLVSAPTSALGEGVTSGPAPGLDPIMAMIAAMELRRQQPPQPFQQPSLPPLPQFPGFGQPPVGQPGAAPPQAPPQGGAMPPQGGFAPPQMGQFALPQQLNMIQALQSALGIGG